jgi:mono/diheme cytochrome c family protein
MRRTTKLIAASAVSTMALLAVAPAGAQDQAVEAAPAEDLPAPAATFEAFDEGAAKFEFLNQYCIECHNFEEWAGGVAFDTMDPAYVADETEVWEHAVTKLRGGLMPPAGATIPADTERFEFVRWMESYLDHVADEAEPYVGHVPLHRLNRKEYANAVRDLLGIEVDAESLLPQDNSAEGFDNIAAVLTVSPSFLEQSLAAARAVAAQAIGDPDARTGGTTYNVSGGDQETHVEGLPLGTRGGMAVEHYFPADGEYVLNIGNLAQRLWVSNQEFTTTVIATYDGEKFFELDIGGGEDLRAIDQVGDPAVDMINERLKNIRFNAEAGPHTVAVTFLHRSFAEHEGLLSPTRPGGGNANVIKLSSFEILGPYDPSGVSETPARNQIFTCYPEADSEARACAEQIAREVGRKAYRGNLVDEDVVEIMAAYDAARELGESFDMGVRRALTAILASPKFLYRDEPMPEGLAPSEALPLTDLELASRLSFFLWSSIPDDELLEFAEKETLSQPRVLEAQVRRMLADEKAKTLATNFAHQWLDVPHLAEVDPDPAIFADVPGNIRNLFVEEIHLFVDDIFRGDKNVTELLTADYTYANEDLALHYGITDVKGDRFRRIEVPSVRAGLLGKGAILASAAYPDRTSPVLRGAYVLEHIMGTPPAPPPPNVEAFPENKPGEKALTVRERLVMHRADPSCNSCHGLMDPLGFALENFDATGRWRDIDRFARTPIDSAAETPNGAQLTGAEDLRNWLLERPDQFVQTLTQKLMMYATGRIVEHQDMPRVREIVSEAQAEDYKFSSLVMGVVTSPQFTMKAVAGPEEEQAEPVQEAALQQE